MAEFENFRKRTDKEKSAMFETGAKSVIENIFWWLTTLKEVWQLFLKKKKDSAFVEGMNKVYKQLMT